jgi:hypothetical protein
MRGMCMRFAIVHCKNKHKVLPAYSHAEDFACSLYGRQNDVFERRSLCSARTEGCLQRTRKRAAKYSAAPRINSPPLYFCVYFKVPTNALEVERICEAAGFCSMNVIVKSCEFDPV